MRDSLDSLREQLGDVMADLRLNITDLRVAERPGGGPRVRARCRRAELRQCHRHTHDGDRQRAPAPARPARGDPRAPPRHGRARRRPGEQRTQRLGDAHRLGGRARRTSRCPTTGTLAPRARPTGPPLDGIDAISDDADGHPGPDDRYPDGRGVVAGQGHGSRLVRRRGVTVVLNVVLVDDHAVVREGSRDDARCPGRPGGGRPGRLARRGPVAPRRAARRADRRAASWPSSTSPCPTAAACPWSARRASARRTSGSWC